MYSVAHSSDGARIASGRWARVLDAGSMTLLGEMQHPVRLVRFAADNRLVTGCDDNVVRTFDADFEWVRDEAGEVRGKYADFHGGDGNVVKVVDNEDTVVWASRNYQLTLKDSNITDVVEISEINKLLWEQHNAIKLIEE